MNPATILKLALEDGVTLGLSAAGTIKVTGDRSAVNRWLPLVREHKPGIMAVLQEAANDLLPDSAMEARRQRVLTVLAEQPGIPYAVVVDNPDTDPVIMVLGIRGQATCELLVPREKFDPFLLLDLIGRHCGTIH